MKNFTLYVAADYCGLEVLDISDPLDLRQVGWWNPYGCEDSLGVWLLAEGHLNELAYRPGHKLLFASAGDAEMLALDLSDPAAPALAASYGEAGNGHVAWGLDAGERYVYLGYVIAPETPYTPFTGTWQGVRILSYELLSSAKQALTASSWLSIAPNPSAGPFAIAIQAEKAELARLRVFNSSGQLAFQESWRLIPGRETYSFEPHLPPGLYFLKVWLPESGQSWQGRLVRR